MSAWHVATAQRILILITVTVISTSSLQFGALLDKNPPSTPQTQPPSLVLPTPAGLELSPKIQPHSQHNRSPTNQAAVAIGPALSPGASLLVAEMWGSPRYPKGTDWGGGGYLWEVG